MGVFDKFPLHKAADDDNLDDEATVAKLEPLLTTRTLDINERAGWDNYTPLILAAYGGKTAAVQLLLRHGAHANIQTGTGTTAMHLAAGNGHAAVVEALLQHGADPAAVDKRGKTARDWAVGMGHGEVVRLLEEATKVLKWLDALENNNEEEEKELFGKIVNVNAAMHYVLGSTKGELVILAAVERLLKAGAETTFKFGGKTALDRALDKKMDKVVAAIVEDGSDSEITHSLSYCAKVHDHEAVKLLLKNARLVKYDWNINANDEEGFTALHHAVEGDKGGEEGTLATVKVMLEQPKIDANVKNESGKTALSLASRKKRKNVVEVLLKAGANVNSADVNGFTALHHAVDGDEGGEEATLATVKELLKHADMKPNIKNTREKTALDLAVEAKKESVVKVISLNAISSDEPLLETMRRSDITKVIENFPELWTNVMTSDNSKKRFKKALEEKQLNDLNVIFNDMDVKVQRKLFHQDKIHLDKKDGKTLLQHLAERGDEISRQREDFVSMLTRIEKEFGENNVDNVIADLKNAMESSCHLVAWIETAKKHFPISSTKMYLQFLVTTFLLIYRLGSYLTDVGTDAVVTQRFHNFSTQPHLNSTFSPTNMSVLKLEVVEQCRNYTQLLDFFECTEKRYHANHQFEQNQFKPEEWNILYILSLIHMLLSWPFFWLLAGYLLKEPCKSVSKTKTCQSLLEVIFFPIATYFQQFWQNIQLSRALNLGSTQSIEEETGQSAENERETRKEAIEKKMETLEEKETLVTTIEVSLESSFQFYHQTLTAIPTFFISIVGAYKSQGSFAKQIFSWQNFSILISFLAMARTFHRIRNLSKQKALSGKAAICNVLLTTLETTARILTVGIFLYLYRENLDAVMAAMMYYGHVSVMIIFNIIFNNQPPTFSFAYLLELLLNSLSSVFTYNHYNYNKLIAPKDDQKESKLHQPTLLRQLVFYVIFIGESIALSAMAALYFDEKEVGGAVMVTNGYGSMFSMSRGNFNSALAFAWFCQGAALVLKCIYYAVHPSNVSIKDFKAKNQIFVWGNSRSFSYSRISNEVDGNLQDKISGEGDEQLDDGEGQTGELQSGEHIIQMDTLTAENQDAAERTLNRAGGDEGEEEKETTFTGERPRDEDGEENIHKKGITASETPLLGK